jgi:hypothetical protein
MSLDVANSALVVVGSFEDEFFVVGGTNLTGFLGGKSDSVFVVSVRGQRLAIRIINTHPRWLFRRRSQDLTVR